MGLSVRTVQACGSVRVGRSVAGITAPQEWSGGGNIGVRVSVCVDGVCFPVLKTKGFGEAGRVKFHDGVWFLCGNNVVQELGWQVRVT